MPVEITERKFRQFIKKDKSTGKKRLTKTKTYIAKYFGIHPKTLRNWMKREGYGYLIGIFKGDPFTTQSKIVEEEEQAPETIDRDDVKHPKPEAEEWTDEELEDSAGSMKIPDDTEF